MSETTERITNYPEFWDFYVSEHKDPVNRYLHFIGTSLALVSLAWFISRGVWFYFPVNLLIGYGFAWVGHFFVEKNRPASFKYPLWSFISDYRMVFYMLTGKMNSEVDRVARGK